MLSRRELITAGVAGSVATPRDGTAAAAPPEQNQAELDLLREIGRRLQGIDDTVERAWLSNTTAFGFVAKIRGQMEVYFRSTQKFPDFMDVGMAVFMDVYDWHIRNRQQLVVTRGPDNRYWMQFMFTTLILRGENDQTYIGIPYDKA